MKNTTIPDKKLFLGITALSSLELCSYTAGRCIRRLLVALDMYKDALDEDRMKRIKNEIAELTIFMLDIRLALNELYDLVGIDSGFRNIVPIHCMERFMCRGAADKLDGAGGLYELAVTALGQENMSYSMSDLYSRSGQKIFLSHELSFELAISDIHCDKLVADTVSYIIQSGSDTGKTPIDEFREERLNLIELYERLILRYI